MSRGNTVTAVSHCIARSQLHANAQEPILHTFPSSHAHFPCAPTTMILSTPDLLALHRADLVGNVEPGLTPKACLSCLRL